MTAPVRPQKTLAQKMHENVVALRQQGAPQERIQDEIDYWGGRMREQGASEDALNPLQKAGALAQTFSDASTLGMSGVLDDAATAMATGDTFGNLRAARQAAKQSVAESNPALSTAAGVAGALATPLPGGTLFRAGAGAGRLARAGIAAGDAALQSGVASGVGALGTGDVATEAGTGAVTGGLLGGGLGGVAGALTRTGQRIARTQDLDNLAVQMRNDIKRVSGEGYGRVLSIPQFGPANPPLVRPVLDIVTDPSVLPHVKELQSYRQFRDMAPSHPRFLDAVYKSMSDEGMRLRESLKKKVGDPAANSIRARAEHIDLVRAELLDAMDTQVPGYGDVVRQHAALKADEGYYERASDIAESVGRGKPLRGRKLKSESRAAFLDELAQRSPSGEPVVSPRQAQLGVAGLLGRGKEAVHLTSSPLGLFGLMGSTVRVPLQAYRTRSLLDALEERAGISYADKEAAARVRGAVARTTGDLQGRRER